MNDAGIKSSILIDAALCRMLERRGSDCRRLLRPNKLAMQAYVSFDELLRQQETRCCRQAVLCSAYIVVHGDVMVAGPREFRKTHTMSAVLPVLER